MDPENNIEKHLFKALVEGLREEAASLDASGLLRQCCDKHRVSRVFQEHVLRYLALRHFYMRNPGANVRKLSSTLGMDASST